MNLRTKTTTVIAALALGITMTAGIAGAAVTNPDTSAVLQGNPGTCTLTLAVTKSIDFGTYVWNTTTGTYDAPSTAGGGTLTFTRTSSGSHGNRPCAPVSISSSVLANGGVTAFTADQVQATGGELSSATSLDTAKELLQPAVTLPAPATTNWTRPMLISPSTALPATVWLREHTQVRSPSRPQTGRHFAR